MKIKTLSVFPISLLFFVSLFSFASAEEYDTEGLLRVNKENKVQVQVNATSAVKINTSNGFASTTSERNEYATKTNSNDNDEYEDDNDDNDKGEMNALVHRSLVASFIQSLNNIADREGGIGDQVRLIARSQGDSASTTLSAMERVEKRGSIMKFLFGADYKNLGVIRSELSITTDNIAQLKLLLSKTTNEITRADLALQIKALELEQVRINAYIAAHEDIFSLFGWVSK